MNLALWKKSFYDGFVLFISIALTAMGFAWFRVKIVAKLETSQFKQIIDILPDDWQKFASVDIEWMLSYLGRMATTLDEPMLIMLVSIWVIVRSSDVVSGGLSRGTHEMILAQPISRVRYFAIHNAVTLLGLLLISLMIWLGMLIAVQTVSVKESVYPEFRIPLTGIEIPLTFFEPEKVPVAMSEHVSALSFWPGILNLFLFGYLLLGISALLSSVDRFRWRTLGISVAIYFASAMFKFGSLSDEAYRWMKYLTYFSLYNAVPFIKAQKDDPESLFHFFAWSKESADASLTFDGLGPLGCNLLLLVLGTFCLWLGARIFRRRDLPAPV